MPPTIWGMITYKVTGEDDGNGYLVVVKETGVVIGWAATRNEALAIANERASLAPGNRVES